MSKKIKNSGFEAAARHILDLKIAHPINALGGYGPDGEVIYTAHPLNCPSVLVDKRANATATFMSNGSAGLVVKLDNGMDVHVLDTSYDGVEKRETGVPSSNVWLALETSAGIAAASVMNPRAALNLEPESIKIVKMGDPDRCMWYCAVFRPAAGLACAAAVRMALRNTPKGPAMVRDVFVRNTGRKALRGNVWTYFNTHGTQVFVYNKEAWYDSGLPVSNTESIVSAVVPYSGIIQLKRISSVPVNMKAVDATCDYLTFMGDSAAFSLMPEAVRAGGMLKGGAGKKLNRFSTASVAANQFAFNLASGASATLRQALLYVADDRVIEKFRRDSGYSYPSYADMSGAFRKAAGNVVASTPGAADIAGKCEKRAGSGHPVFELKLPAVPAVSEYANSVWTGVQELYEVCRAHGAKLANGIEIGTRDRGQDMWPKMKEDPGVVRADLVHALSLMYVTSDERELAEARRLTLPQKLHGMFTRQYPSRWDDRSEVVYNDNRPYADSPLWLLNSLNMYIRETGDFSILTEVVKTIRLTDPEHPEVSGITGCDREMPVAGVAMEILACFRRHVKDSPYGLAQIMYGDWCDPIDMFGTSEVGDSGTRGKGRGAQVRLSAHLFLTLVETIDVLDAPAVAEALSDLRLGMTVGELKKFASDLRRRIVEVAWEDGPKGFKDGFIDCIHELREDGTRPDYAGGEIGYTLGSMKGLDFDGVKRRELATQAFCLEMLNTSRPYLEEIPRGADMIKSILDTADTLFFDRKLGYIMFVPPIANNRRSLDYVGRMGIVPSGCAENGEYHHCQVFMHRYRLNVPGEADKVWDRFEPILTVTRDETVSGPFETPSNSYASDSSDPHFGRGMYFGLSGQVDWLVEIFHQLAGVELALHDGTKPAVKVSPRLPKALEDQLVFKRVIHLAAGPGKYREIPLTVETAREGTGRLKEINVRINGKKAASAEIRDLAGVKSLHFKITYVRG
ncbi:MAG: hypothetical protein JW909_03405 [Planctomycetes bacterium]|nr:hypothetical protein [Planctomycetota bacterium]